MTSDHAICSSCNSKLSIIYIALVHCIFNTRGIFTNRYMHSEGAVRKVNPEFGPDSPFGTAFSYRLSITILLADEFPQRRV